MRLIAPRVLPTLALLAGLFGCGSETTSTSSSGGNPPECSQWQPAWTASAKDFTHSLTAADLDGDGKPELVTAGVGSVGVMRNLGDGTFAKVVVFPNENFPNNVAAADLNGDGKPDLVVASFYSNQATVLLNGGDGTFTPGADILVDADPDSNPSGLAAVDLNGDGHPDLAFSVLKSDAGIASVVLNQGDGTFAAPVSYPAGITPYELTAADLDGDGKPELAITDESSDELLLLFNQGDGSFAASVTHATGDEPAMVVAADLNGDGRPDLVVANHEVDDLNVLLQEESGTFVAAASYLTGAGATSVAVDDLDRDGALDIAVVRNTSERNDLAVIYGEGNGTFGPVVYSTLAHFAMAVAAADLNGDGAPDLAVANNYGTVTVLLNCAE